MFEVFFFPYSYSYNVFPISSWTACFICPVFEHSLFHFLAYSITSCFSLKVQPAFSFSSKKLSSFFYRLANTSRPTLTNLEIDLFALHFLTFSPNAKVLSAEKVHCFHLNHLFLHGSLLQQYLLLMPLALLFLLILPEFLRVLF